MYPDIPMEGDKNISPLGETNIVLDFGALNGMIGDRSSRDSAILVTKIEGSNLSLSKRMSLDRSTFYRLSRLGSQYSLGDSIHTDGSTWTVASSVNEHREVDDPNYAADVLVKLNHFRNLKKYVDFTIHVGNQSFDCHKVVLASTSRYFAVNLADDITEEGKRVKKRELTLTEVEPRVVQALIDYIYTSKLTISSDNAAKMLAATRIFNLQSAEQACLDFLERQDNRQRDSYCESSQNIATEYTFEQPYHVNEILLGLNDMRHDGRFIDTYFCVDNEELPCHKVVVATIDHFMEERLEDVGQNCRITVNDVKLSVLKMIINYTYTSRLEVCEENASEALMVACKMQHQSAIRKCSDFIKKKLNAHNCLGVMRAARDPSCEYLQKAATKFALKNFPEVIRCEEFSELAADELLDYLGDDNLNLRSEEEAFHALLKWLEYDLCVREPFLPDVIRAVRLPYVGPRQLEKEIEGNSLVQRNNQCLDIIMEAKELQALIRENKHTKDPRHKPRRAYSDVTFVVGGKNKQQEWVQDTCYYDNVRRKWYPLAKFPSGNTQYKVVSLHGDVYVVGGCDKGDYVSGDVWRYISLYDEWKQVASLKTPRYAHGVGVLHDRIYVVGGRVKPTGEPSNGVERYGRQSDVWKMGEEMTYGVEDPVVTAHSRRLYVIGGYRSNGHVMVQCFHLEKNAWTVVDDVSLTMEPSVAATLKSKIYLVGGKTEYKVEVYNPHKGEVQAVGEMPHAEAHTRELYSATVTNRKINVTGGQWTVGMEDALTISTNSFEQYDPVSNEWTVLGPMPRALTHHGCVTIKKYIGLPRSMVQRANGPSFQYKC